MGHRRRRAVQNHLQNRTNQLGEPMSHFNSVKWAYVMKLVWFLGILILYPGSFSHCDGIAPRVRAAGESLEGVWLNSNINVAVFKSIPYAAAPTGEWRWKAPQPHVPRKGVQLATEFKSACPQLQGNHEWYRNVGALFGVNPRNGDLGNISEDCLHLNIWTSNPGGKKKLPVMVWIHGGSNTNGYSFEPNYQGYEFAQHGVVLVSINYRLGVLGFLAHPALSAEDIKHSSGYYGFLDQIAALGWVKANIEAFGGDPKNVTVFGESAGAADIGTLLLSRHSSDLFKRAIIQSGGFEINSFETLKEGESRGIELTNYLKLPQSETQLKLMRSIGWKALVEAVPKALPGYYFDARIDNWFMDEPAASAFSAGRIHPADLLIGSNANESFMYIPTGVSADDVKNKLKDILPHYPEGGLQKLLEKLGPRQQMDRLVTAEQYLCTARYIAKSVADTRNSVYFYHFDRNRPGAEQLLAYHGAEIPYVFNSADNWLPSNTTDRMLEQFMIRAWSNFAKTGNPNDGSSTEWPTFESDTQKFLLIGNTLRVAQHPEQLICDVFDLVLEKKMAAFAKRQDTEFP